MRCPIQRVGFAAVGYELDWTTNRTFRLANLSPARLAETVAINLDNLEALLDWMQPRGLRLFRLGSSLIPFASHPNLDWDWTTCCAARLRSIGERYAAEGFRFSMHPGQYNVLNSPRPAVVQQAIAELTYSCRVLDLMGLDASHKVILHGGGIFGDRAASTARLCRQIAQLPSSIRQRLVLENDERQFNFEQILEISEATGTPAVFDLHHHQLNSSPDIAALLRRSRAVWDSTPKVHLSSQKHGARPGAHDVMIDRRDFDTLCELLPFEADLMIEAKGKEVAALEVLFLCGR